MTNIRSLTFNVYILKGYENQLELLFAERRLASAPRKGGQTPYFSHSSEPVTAEEDARLEAEKKSRLAEENAKALLSLSAISRSRWVVSNNFVKTSKGKKLQN